MGVSLERKNCGIINPENYIRSEGGGFVLKNMTVNSTGCCMG